VSEVSEVSEVPDPLGRLRVVLEALAIAHETIYDLHRALVSAERATPASAELLTESARLVMQDAPKASAAAWGLASRWHEQTVLDPDAAERTAIALDEEVGRAELALRMLLGRVSAIAAELRALAADDR
jgi:hypothetical protein